MAKRQTSSYYGQLQDLSKYWNIQPDGGQCQGPTDVLLWFVALWTMSGLWALLLGSRDVRSFIRGKLDFESPFKTKKGNYICACVGSLVLHICMTIATGYVFGGSDNLLNPTLAWFVRPLPTVPTILISFFDQHTFKQNNIELSTVDTFYSIFSIGLIGQVASLALPLSEDQSTSSGQLESYGQAIAVLQGGSAVGMVAWILTLLFLAAGVALGAKVTIVKRFFCGATQGKFLPILLCLIFLRLLGDFLLWSGAALLIPSVFCPTDYMTAVVSVIWALVVPVADHLWRAAFTFDSDTD